MSQIKILYSYFSKKIECFFQHRLHLSYQLASHVNLYAKLTPQIIVQDPESPDNALLPNFNLQQLLVVALLHVKAWFPWRHQQRLMGKNTDTGHDTHRRGTTFRGLALENAHSRNQKIIVTFLTDTTEQSIGTFC